MLMASAASLAGPYLTKLAVDSYIAEADLAGLNLIFVLLVLSYGLYWFFYYHQSYLSRSVGQKVVGEIREDLYQHLQGLPMSFYSQESTGNIMSAVTHDVNELSNLLSTGFIHLLNDFFTLAGIVMIMLWLDVRLALYTFILIPFIIFSVHFLGRKMRNAYQEVREKLAELNADLEENLSGIRLVQALNREAKNSGEFSTLSWKNLKSNLAAASYFALLFPLMELSRVLGEGIIIVFGGQQTAAGAVSLGILIAFMGYVRRFFAPLADLSQVYNTYQSAGAALDRIHYFMSLKLDAENYRESEEFTDGFIPQVEFKEVSFSYSEPEKDNFDTPKKENDREMVLKNLSFKIEAGSVFALVGPTGAGKSTVAKLLSRLYYPDEGRILISNKDLGSIKNSVLRKKLSVVPQDIFLFDSTVLDNIRYADPSISQAEVEEICRRINADQFIKKLPNGYQSRVGEAGVKLSGGQKQLLSFARALVSDPEILILDEAASSVDAYTEKIIENSMQELFKERTVLIIAHRFSSLKNAEKIAVLEKGRLNGIGSHVELIKKNQLYQDLVEKQLLD